MRKLRMLAVLLILIGTAFESHALSDKEREILDRKQRTEGCHKTLKSLYGVLYKYSRSNKGFLPAKNNYAGLKLLISYGATAADFTCKASRAKKVKKIEDLSERSNSFLYFGGINLQQAEKKYPNLILMCDKPDSRHLTVLFASGDVKSIDRKEFKPKTAVDIIVYLNKEYKYPAQVYNLLLKKARAMDKELGYSK